MGHSNPKRKGNRFENKIAKLFSKWTGYRWKRTIGSGATKHEKGDITPADTYKPWVIELKNQQSWSYKDLWTGKGPVWKWWNKCAKECKKDERPMLIIKKNRSPALILLDAPLPRDYVACSMMIPHRGRAVYVGLLDEFIKVVDGETFF